MNDANEFKTDHDAIITFITEFRGFRTQVMADIREIKDNTKATLTDHEARLRALEDSTISKGTYDENHREVVEKVNILYKYLYIGFGAIAVLQIIIGYVLDHYGR